MLSLLLCELRAERASFPAQTEAAVTVARLNLLLRYAREAGWCVAHAGLKRRTRGGPILGLEPLRSEAVFAVEAGAFDPGPLIETLTGGDRPLVLAGFGFHEIGALIVNACTREGRAVVVVEDAIGWGPERDFALRGLARRGVRITTAQSLMGVDRSASVTDNPRP